MTRVLAVAHQTAEAAEFLAAVESAATASRAEVVVLVPATPVKHLASWTQGESRAIAQERAETARKMLENAGVEVAEVMIGDPDPYEAIIDVLAVEDFDLIIVSTFPPGISRWLGANLISRLGRTIDVPVTHVVAH